MTGAPGARKLEAALDLQGHVEEGADSHDDDSGGVPTR